MSKSNKGQPPFETREEESKIMKGDNSGKSKPNNRGSRGRSNNSRNNPKVNPYRQQKSSEPLGVGGTSNAPEWHITNPQLKQDAARLPFAYPTGDRINPQSPVFSKNSTQGNFTVPGILSLYVTSSAGYSNSETSPLNTAAQKLYMDLAKEKSGRTPFDAADCAIYIQCASDIYGCLAWLRRVYRDCFIIMQTNRYVPQALLEAERVNYEDVSAHLADFRTKLNQLILKANSFPVPSNLTLFTYKAYMFENIFKELDTNKSQYYLIAPDSFYSYVEPESEDYSSSAVHEPIPNYGSADELLSYAEGLIDAIFYNTDMQSIGSWISQTYGNLFSLNLVPEIEVFNPIEDPTMLDMIKNATVVFGADGGDLDQDSTKSFVICRPQIYIHRDNSNIPPELQQIWNLDNELAIGALQVASQFVQEKRILTSQNVDVSPDEVIDKTRLVVTGDNYVRNSTFAKSDLYGASLLCTGGAVWYYLPTYTDNVGWSMTLRNDVLHSFTPIIIGADDSLNLSTEVKTAIYNSIVDQVKAQNRISSFKYHPMVHVIHLIAKTKTGSNATEMYGYSATDGFYNYDMDNICLADENVIRNIQNVVVMNELGLS